MNLTLINSGSYEIFNMPDYPDYPDCDDMYNTQLERIEINPQFFFITNRPDIYQKNMKIVKDLTE